MPLRSILSHFSALVPAIRPRYGRSKFEAPQIFLSGFALWNFASPRAVAYIFFSPLKGIFRLVLYVPALHVSTATVTGPAAPTRASNVQRARDDEETVDEETLGGVGMGALGGRPREVAAPHDRNQVLFARFFCSSTPGRMPKDAPTPILV